MMARKCGAERWAKEANTRRRRSFPRLPRPVRLNWSQSLEINMSDDRKKTLIGSFVASMVSLCGCGQPGAPPKPAAAEPTVIEAVSVKGFDADGEPVIKKWSDGSIWIH